MVLNVALVERLYFLTIRKNLLLSFYLFILDMAPEAFLSQRVWVHAFVTSPRHDSTIGMLPFVSTVDLEP